MSVRLSSLAAKTLKKFSPPVATCQDCPPVTFRPKTAKASAIFIDSKVLGRPISISWSEDGSKVWVDGVLYEDHEIRGLMAKHICHKTLRGIHETKRAFKGTIEK